MTKQFKRILVCGGRDYTNWERVRGILDNYASIYSDLYDPNDNWLPCDITIIAGGAKGADDLAAQWAAINWSGYEEYKANWDKHGKRAGYLRNKQMLDEGKPDMVVAFPGGKGTDMMVRLAYAADIPVVRVDHEVSEDA